MKVLKDYAKFVKKHRNVDIEVRMVFPVENFSKLLRKWEHGGPDIEIQTDSEHDCYDRRGKRGDDRDVRVGQNRARNTGVCLGRGGGWQPITDGPRSSKVGPPVRYANEVPSPGQPSEDADYDEDHEEEDPTPSDEVDSPRRGARSRVPLRPPLMRRGSKFRGVDAAA